MIIHKESHLDHGITQAQMDYIVERFKNRDAFFIETIELPEHLGTVPCALYGKTMGDGPLLVSYRRRGERAYDSRVTCAPLRPTRLLTVIAGPYDGNVCVLYTAFGGPLTPKEPGDPTLTEKERVESEAFWSEHALAVEG